ncbi:MAG: hypothetical protein RL605_1070 [Actinomycetota bacterium]|jgi:hypothetical protein
MRKLVALGLVTMALVLPISTVAASAEESDNESTSTPSAEPTTRPTARPTARPGEKHLPVIKPTDAARLGSGVGSGSDDNEGDDAVTLFDPVAEDRAHHELEKLYGKEGSFQMPALVVKPQGKLTFGSNGATQLTTTHPAGQSATATNTSGSGVSGSAGSAGSAPIANTIAAKPIDFDVVLLNQQTPADIFFQSTTIAITVMAIGAAAFGGVVAVRNVRTVRGHGNQVDAPDNQNA